MSNHFIFGDTVFLAAYYSDREVGDSAKYRIKTPNNMIWESWNQVSSTVYNASWYYWKRLLPQNGPFGIWKFEIEFNGQTYVHEFQYATSLSIEDENNKTKRLVLITDILGRETNEEGNMPLFYLYEDGTVEKKIIIE